MKSLFICATPLHCLIAEKIINEKNLKQSGIDIVYYTYQDNDIHKRYYDKISKKTSDSIYIYVKKRTFSYFSLIRKNVKNKKYDNIYLSNLDSTLVHFILSISDFNSIITFDDGIASIALSDSSVIDYKISPRQFIRNIIYYLLGNRYSQKRIEKEISSHYTIYPRFKHKHKNVVSINLFDSVKLNSQNKKKECTVLLGTVYSEIAYFLQVKKEIILNLVQNFISNNQMDIIYIPHPRDREKYFEKIITDESPFVAEEKIIKLSEHYGAINLFGFASSAQFNLMFSKNIINYYFTIGPYNSDFNKLAEQSNFIEIKLG